MIFFFKGHEPRLNPVKYFYTLGILLITRAGKSLASSPFNMIMIMKQICKYINQEHISDSLLNYFML